MNNYSYVHLKQSKHQPVLVKLLLYTVKGNMHTTDKIITF